MSQALTTEEFIEKAEAIHGDRYDYSHVKYVNSKTKVEIICPVHGSFFQTPNNHLSGKGCQYCAQDAFAEGYRRLSGDEFIEKARKVHGDRYDYSKVDYVNMHEKVCVICKKHGEFWVTPTNHVDNGRGCPDCRVYKGEERIRQYLDEHDIEYIHDKACLECLGKKRPDFYLPEKNMVIEFDGIQHFKPVESWGGESELERQKKSDREKNKILKKNGIEVLRIPYNEFDKMERVLDKKIILI